MSDGRGSRGGSRGRAGTTYHATVKIHKAHAVADCASHSSVRNERLYPCLYRRERSPDHTARVRTSRQAHCDVRNRLVNLLMLQAESSPTQSASKLASMCMSDVSHTRVRALPWNVAASMALHGSVEVAVVLRSHRTSARLARHDKIEALRVLRFC